MLVQQLNRSDAEKIFIIVQNISGLTTSQGAFCSFDYLATSSLGNAVATPRTSTLSLFAGVLDADLASDAYGLCQVYGYRASVAFHAGAASLAASPAGLIIGPAAGLWSGQTNGRSFNMGPVMLIENSDLSGASWVKGFIRAL